MCLWAGAIVMVVCPTHLTAENGSARRPSSVGRPAGSKQQGSIVRRAWGTCSYMRQACWASLARQWLHAHLTPLRLQLLMLVCIHGSRCSASRATLLPAYNPQLTHLLAASPAAVAGTLAGAPVGSHSALRLCTACVWLGVLTAGAIGFTVP